MSGPNRTRAEGVERLLRSRLEDEFQPNQVTKWDVLTLGGEAILSLASIADSLETLAALAADGSPRGGLRIRGDGPGR